MTSLHSARSQEPHTDILRGAAGRGYSEIGNKEKRSIFLLEEGVGEASKGGLGLVGLGRRGLVRSFPYSGNIFLGRSI